MRRRPPSTHTRLVVPPRQKHGGNRHLGSLHFVFFGVVTALAAAVITVAIKSGITVAAVAGMIP
jgi:hypothetical protein